MATKSLLSSKSTCFVFMVADAITILVKASVKLSALFNCSTMIMIVPLGFFYQSSTYSICLWHYLCLWIHCKKGMDNTASLLKKGWGCPEGSCVHKFTGDICFCAVRQQYRSVCTDLDI